MYVSAKKAKGFYNVSEDTLRRWSNSGKIESKKTKGGHNRYFIESKEKGDKLKICYAKVSSRKQENDLKRQIEFLQSKYPDYKILSDIGSGLNYKRKQFKYILEQLFKRNIKEVVVASPDRWTRFGANELFKWQFEQFGATLTFVSEKSSKLQDELSDQIMEILTVFTTRYNGKRKYKIDNTKD